MSFKDIQALLTFSPTSGTSESWFLSLRCAPGSRPPWSGDRHPSGQEAAAAGKVSLFCSGCSCCQGCCQPCRPWLASLALCTVQGLASPMHFVGRGSGLEGPAGRTSAVAADCGCSPGPAPLWSEDRHRLGKRLLQLARYPFSAAAGRQGTSAVAADCGCPPRPRPPLSGDRHPPGPEPAAAGKVSLFCSGCRLLPGLAVAACGCCGGLRPALVALCGGVPGRGGPAGRTSGRGSTGGQPSRFRRSAVAAAGRQGTSAVAARLRLAIAPPSVCGRLRSYPRCTLYSRFGSPPVAPLPELRRGEGFVRVMVASAGLGDTYWMHRPISMLALPGARSPEKHSLLSNRETPVPTARTQHPFKHSSK